MCRCRRPSCRDDSAGACRCARAVRCSAFGGSARCTARRADLHALPGLPCAGLRPRRSAPLRPVRPAGSVPGFEYSAAMKRSKIIWDEKTLDRFLAKPLAMVPGGAMTYDGVPDPKERVDLIAYLKQAQQTPKCRNLRSTYVPGHLLSKESTPMSLTPAPAVGGRDRRSSRRLLCAAADVVRAVRVTAHRPTRPVAANGGVGDFSVCTMASGGALLESPRRRAGPADRPSSAHARRWPVRGCGRHVKACRFVHCSANEPGR
jgi:hypothetical protein